MPSSEGVTTKLGPATADRTTRLRFARPRWWQVVLNVAYVLVAGPRGLGYLLVLTIALAVDLPYVALRLLLAGCLAVLEASAGVLLWLVRYGLRFVWVGTVMLVVWLLRTVWRLCRSVGRMVVGIVRGVLVDIMHPRGAWQRAVRSLHHERERIRVARVPGAARRRSSIPTLRWRGERLVDVYAVGANGVWRRVLPHRWLVASALWRYLALWEGRHTMRWLDIALPALAPPANPAGRTTVLEHLPAASLGYLLAKIPMGALAVALVGLALGIGLELENHGFTGASLVGALVAVYALHLLAQLLSRVAQYAFSPSAAVRRLQEAEALAAHARAKAERADQSRRDLIINVSHELRTPTASILGHVESVLLALEPPDGQIPPATLRTYLEIVQREAKRLSALVDDLLSVASAERAELQLVIAPVDAAGVIHEVYQALAPLARRERQVMLVEDVPPHLPPLLADRQRLSQVLLNLVRNAIAYTPAGGLVSIAGCRDGDRIQLTVADTGSGIAPADLARVFERFYRTDASRARESGGFGLGLAIAQDLVAAMGGTIAAESVVGQGSCFHVSLPIARREYEVEGRRLKVEGRKI